MSFTVASPAIQTRAVADGNTVDKVACCVYNSDGELIEDETISQTVQMVNGKATFKVRLVTGQTYSFLFWAYKSSVENGWTSPYTLNEADKTVTVSYDVATSNDENRDAFYRYIASKTITGAVNETVELYRPFAQLNFGVEQDDIKAASAAGITVSKSKVTLTGLANVLNLEDGSVSGDVDATFDFASCLTDMTNPDNLSGASLLKVKGKSTGYGYVAMNYVLVGKDEKTVTNAELTIAKADDSEINTLKVNSVPLQGNYRTNVVGNLFTSEVIETIVVEPEFTDETVQEFVSITAESIQNANALIEQNKDADIIEVKFAANPEDVASKAILTTKVKESGTLNVEVAADADEKTTLYVGDYTDETVSENMPTDNTANAATVNIIISENTKIGKIVVNAPTKTVKFNGVAIADGEYTIEELEAITSKTTLVIEKGQAIKKLVFHKGGLEIHGTVDAVEIQILDEDKGKDAKEVIEVRECENLNSTVFSALEKYIKTGYVSRQNENGSYDIFAPVKIGNVGYATLKDAVDAVGSEETTITLIGDLEISSSNTVSISGKKIVLNTNGQTIKTSGKCRAIEIDSGELTVNGGGKIIAVGGSTGEKPGYAILNLYSGKLTVENVYLEHPNTCVAVTGGAAVINEAEMKAVNGGACVFCRGSEAVVDVNSLRSYCSEDDTRGAGACWADEKGTIRIWNGSFEFVTCVPVQQHEEAVNYSLFDYRELVDYGWVPGNIIVYGGTFKNFNPAKDHKGNSYVAEGYQSVEDNGYWTVSKKLQ